MCTRGFDRALLCGPSTSPLDRILNPFARILLGALCGWVLVAASSWIYGILIVATWVPSPIPWWRHHVHLVWAGFQLIALLPCIAALGFLFLRLFKERPALSAFASMLIALLVSFGSTFLTPDLILPTIRLTWGFFTPLLIGPPLVVLLVERMRSNNRWRGP